MSLTTKTVIVKSNKLNKSTPKLSRKRRRDDHLMNIMAPPKRVRFIDPYEQRFFRMFKSFNPEDLFKKDMEEKSFFKQVLDNAKEKGKQVLKHGKRALNQGKKVLKALPKATMKAYVGVPLFNNQELLPMYDLNSGRDISGLLYELEHPDEETRKRFENVILSDENMREAFSKLFSEEKDDDDNDDDDDETMDEDELPPRSIPSQGALDKMMVRKDKTPLRKPDEYEDKLPPVPIPRKKPDEYEDEHPPPLPIPSEGALETMMERKSSADINRELNGENMFTAKDSKGVQKPLRAAAERIMSEPGKTLARELELQPDPTSVTVFSQVLSKMSPAEVAAMLIGPTYMTAQNPAQQQGMLKRHTDTNTDEPQGNPSIAVKAGISGESSTSINPTNLEQMNPTELAGMLNGPTHITAQNPTQQQKILKHPKDTIIDEPQAKPSIAVKPGLVFNNSSTSVKPTNLDKMNGETVHTAQAGLPGNSSVSEKPLVLLKERLERFNHGEGLSSVEELQKKVSQSINGVKLLQTQFFEKYKDLIDGFKNPARTWEHLSDFFNRVIKLYENINTNLTPVDDVGTYSQRERNRLKKQRALLRNIHSGLGFLNVHLDTINRKQFFLEPTKTREISDLVNELGVICQDIIRDYEKYM